MQMTAMSINAAITGGKLFVNIKQSYVNTDGSGCPVFRFMLPEKAFVNKLEIKTPEKNIYTEYISVEDSDELEDNIRNASSPLTFDESGYFSAVIGAVKPQQTIDISFTYIQAISKARSVKVILPIQTNERLAPGFNMDASLKWHTAIDKITATGSHQVTVAENTVSLLPGNIPDKNIILDLKAEDCSQCNLYAGNNRTLLDVPVPFEPLRTGRSYEYLFMIDLSRNIREHWDNIKNALLSCICALEENETFNIIAFGETPRLLSIGFLKANEISRNSAKMWLSDLKPSGSSDFGEALSFANDLCTHKTRVIAATNSPFGNGESLIASAQSKKFHSLSIISGVEKDTDTILRVAKACDGYSYRLSDSRELADGLCRLLSRCLLTGIENFNAVSDKPLVWNIQKQEKIYPWDKISMASDSTAPVPETVKITGNIGPQEFNYTVAVQKQTKAADFLAAVSIAEGKDKERALTLSKNHNIPSAYSKISMKVEMAEENRLIHFPLRNADGGGSDKPTTVRKNPLALLAMQDTTGAIGNETETAGRLWEIMTTHPTPSIFILQIKKAIEFLFDYIQSGEYDILPERILDVFELYIELFPSESIFAKKLEDIVYMNRK